MSCQAPLTLEGQSPHFKRTLILKALTLEGQSPHLKGTKPSP